MIVPGGLFAAGDVPTTFSDAQFIEAVNWGNITTTDTAIQISGAHLIPFEDVSGPILYQIEYGKIDNTGQTFLASSNPTIAQPPLYGFNLSIPGLTPNTEYYLTVLEYYPPGDPNEGSFNLFTYGYATTALLSGSIIHHTFPNTTSINVYGQLVSSNGSTFANTPITIVLQNSNHQDITSAQVVTGGFNYATGNAAFSHLFNNLNIVPNSQNFIVIRDTNTGLDLTEPAPFTTPANDTSGTGGGNTTPIPPAPTNGLIACNGADDCDFAALVATIDRVIKFLIFYVAFPIVAIVVAWAGWLLLTSGGNPGARDKAKGMIGKVVGGLIIALLAWAIVKLILITLGYSGPLLQVFPE